jgi:O-antigen/teichoic acid export membrane protein
MLESERRRNNDAKNGHSYGYSILSSGVALALGIATGVLVNRVLGPELRGEFASISYAAATASGVMATLVSSQAIIWHINQGGRISSVLFVIALQAVSCLPLVAMLMALFHVQGAVVIWIAVALAVVVASAQVFYNGLCAIHRALSNFKSVAITVVLIPILYAAFLVGFALPRKLDAATAMVASGLPIIICVGLLIKGFRLGPHPGSSFWPEVSTCIRHGVTFLPVTLLSLVLASADRALILKLSDLESLGYFVAAAGLSSPLATAAEAIVQVSFVEVSTARSSSNRAEASRVALARFRVSQVVLVVLAAGLAVVAPWFLVVASGPEFKDAVPVLFWLIGAAAIRSLVTLLDGNLRALGLLRYSFVTLVLGIAVLVTAGLLLVPSLGAVGAAQSVLVGYVAMLIAQIAFWRCLVGAAWTDFWGLTPGTVSILWSGGRKLFHLGRTR